MENLASWEPPKEISESWPILHVGHDAENTPSEYTLNLV